MVRRGFAWLLLLALLSPLTASPVVAASEPRIALVVGNGAYAKGPLKTALNDAGLVAEALRSVGFDVVEGADLGQADFLRRLREFLGKLEAAGPGATAFVYFSGYAFAYDGDNFFVAADARLDGENDIPLDAMRLTDLLRALSGAPARATIVAIDAARRLPFGIAGLDLPSGLATLAAPRGMLIATAAEPGTLTEDGAGPYGPYASAIAEMIRSPGLDIVDVFSLIRARTHQSTEGRQVPWNVSALAGPLVLVPGDPAAEAATARLRQRRPMTGLGPEEAYALAIETDDLSSYVDYLQAYPTSPYTRRIWAIVRARREALAWLRAFAINSPDAYWTYLDRYPTGIYVGDAGRRLRRLSAPMTPPPGFVAVEFVGVPPALAQEPPMIIPFFSSPPRPPARLIAPPPALFATLPPPRRSGRGLPAPPPLPAPAGLTPGTRVMDAPVNAPANAPVNAPAAATSAAPAIVGPPPTRPMPSLPNNFRRLRPRTLPSSALAPSPQPGTFRPRQGQSSPGTAGLPLAQPQRVFPIRRPGEIAIAPAGAPPAAGSGQSQPNVASPLPPLQQITRPQAPQVNRPTLPTPPAIQRLAPSQMVVRPPAVSAASPQPPPAAKICVTENGQQVCR